MPLDVLYFYWFSQVDYIWAFVTDRLIMKCVFTFQITVIFGVHFPTILIINLNRIRAVEQLMISI